MASRSKNAVRSFETEIEKSREESNWKKAIELAQQLKARSAQHGQYCDLKPLLRSMTFVLGFVSYHSLYLTRVI